MRVSDRFSCLLVTGLLLLFPLLAIPSGAQEKETASVAVTYDQLVKNYRAALRDAQEMRVSKIATDLTLIARSNPKLQWKTIEGQEYVKLVLLSDNFYDAYVGKPLDVGMGRTTWVGVPADYKAWYDANHPAPSRLLLRLKQLLGLPPDVMKTRIVELWARPTDLKRPSIEPTIDKEIDLSTLFTGSSNSQNNWYRPHGDDTFNAWFYRQCAESYVVPPDDQSLYPWTRLGYTYDWGNPLFPHIGVSEFIVWGGEGVKVWIASSIKPEDYFQFK